ncbi:MAG: hypothetical protein DSY42_01090 [Aquifex sp.]|nr:MAG: hypothetical protein DSY42_01090 [Aquifex sp.]
MRKLAGTLLFITATAFGLDLIPSPILFVSKAQLENKTRQMNRELEITIRKQPVYERLYRKIINQREIRKYERLYRRDIARLYRRENIYERQIKEVWYRYPDGRMVLGERKVIRTVYKGSRTKYLGNRVERIRYIGKRYIGSIYQTINTREQYLGTRYKHTCYFIGNKLEGCW